MSNQDLYNAYIKQQSKIYNHEITILVTYKYSNENNNDQFYFMQSKPQTN